MSDINSIMAKHSYLNRDYKLLYNVLIREYDMENAGMNIIKFLKLIPEQLIKRLESYSKERMNILVGRLELQNRQLADNMLNEFIKIRQSLAIVNNIEDTQILSIKKDAVFTINKVLDVTRLTDNYNFRIKNIFTSYALLDGIEFYYSSYDEKITVKGIPEESKTKQQSYFLNDIKTILKLNETSTKEEMFNHLSRYRSLYLSKKLNIETYRNLRTGNFDIGSCDYFDLTEYSETFYDDIDISYNYLNYIIPLISYIL